MGIGYINDYNSFLQNYRVPTIPSVSIEDLQNAEQEKKAQEVIDVVETKNVQDVSPVRKNTSLEDISITFHKESQFDYLGKDSDIENLDMRKAISDMEKDRVLQHYQYFVGSGGSVSENGTVIVK